MSLPLWCKRCLRDHHSEAPPGPGAFTQTHLKTVEVSGLFPRAENVEVEEKGSASLCEKGSILTFLGTGKSQLARVSKADFEDPGLNHSFPKIGFLNVDTIE